MRWKQCLFNVLVQADDQIQKIQGQVSRTSRVAIARVPKLSEYGCYIGRVVRQFHFSSQVKLFLSIHAAVAIPKRSNKRERIHESVPRV